MALSLQLGFPVVPKSITNPNVNINDSLDVGSPMSFLTFIKLINVSFEPDSLQGYYNHYLNLWNVQTNGKDLENSNIIIERYRDFLKDISLNYTTLEEKDFLSKIDFNDPYDLDAAMGFYGDKIKELIQFYNNKRNNVKFSVLKNKLIGSNQGIEKNILELTVSYLKNYDDGKMLYDLDAIKENLQIEIDELYDTYPLYFDQLPDEKKYDNKDLDYGFDIFLKDDATLINQIFSNVSQELRDIKEVDQLFENKRKLTQKYIATDFYYLSTGNTVNDFLSGKLFESENDISNLFNRHYPTTASTPNVDYLQKKQDIGFFKPSKTSILLLDGVNNTFSFNLQNLEPNSLYYFADPKVTGDNGDVLTFIIDTSFIKRNFSSGNAVNQPYSTPHDTKYYGYVSNIDPNPQKYLDSIFDSGFIQDGKYDIFGNLFGLFKNDHRFRQSIEVVDNVDINAMIITGHTIYDDIFGEGFNFNYTTTNSESANPYRTGLYTATAPLSTNDFDVVLSFGKLFQYAEPIYEEVFNMEPAVDIIEGAYLSRYDLTPYPDAVSTDTIAWDTSFGEFYYTDLVEGGLFASSPVQRPLLSPLLPADMTQYIRGSALNVVDGGYFRASTDTGYNLIEDGYAYDATVFNPTILTLSSFAYDDDFNSNGVIFVKNKYTKQIYPLLDAMPYLKTLYDDNIVEELSSNIVKFDVSNDVMFLETPSYLVTSKILFDGVFKDPNISPIYVQHSENSFDKLSNRFKVKNLIFYCKMNVLSDSLSSNNFTLYPEIYKIDTINFTSTKIFPKTLSDVTNNTEFFSVSGNDVRYVSADAPVLTYSGINDIFNISLLLKDQNNMPCIHEFDFHLAPDAVFSKHNIYKFSNNQVSNTFDNLSTLSIYLSASTPITILEELVL